jgi:hypothetical protein
MQVIQRLYSSAYNCLSIVVGKTQNLEKFYNLFLFKSSENNFWIKIIDCDIVYDFINESGGFESVIIGAGDQSGEMGVRNK